MKDRLNSKGSVIEQSQKSLKYSSNNLRWKHKNVVKKAKLNVCKLKRITTMNYNPVLKDKDAKLNKKNADKPIANNNFKMN